MKTFFEEFKKSFSDKSWYKDIIEGKVPFKVSYPIKLVLISSVVICLFLSILMYKELIPRSKAFMLEAIPGDLVVTIKSGILSINKPVPYVLPLPEEEREEGKKNFVVINTNEEANFQSTEKYDTLIFVSKDTIVGKKGNAEIKAFSLKEMPDSTITRDTVIDVFEKVAGYMWILPIVAIVPVAIALFCQVMLLFLVSSVLLWILLKIASRPALFKNTFIASMYAYSIVFAANLILWIIQVPSFRFSYQIIIVTIIALVFILKSKKEEISGTNTPIA